MRLNIRDEFSPLKRVIVCYGGAVTDDGSRNLNHDPYLFKPKQKRWNKNLLLKQQEKFFALLEMYRVKVILIPPQKHLWQQMFARDIGFVYGDKFFYAPNRHWHDRQGEHESVLPLIKGEVVAVDGAVEGGDVLVTTEELYVGISNRTTREAVEFLRKRYKFLPITLEEAHNLGGNVVMINPETVVVEKSQKRIADILRKEKFKVELVEYTEPVALEGAFRCTTLPLEKAL